MRVLHPKRLPKNRAHAFEYSRKRPAPNTRLTLGGGTFGDMGRPLHGFKRGAMLFKILPAVLRRDADIIDLTIKYWSSKFVPILSKSWSYED